MALVVLSILAVIAHGFRQHMRIQARFSLSLSSTVQKSPSVMSDQLREMRENMAKDEKVSLMMDALRGKNLNDDDRQGDGIDMKVVEMRKGENAEDVLPTNYNAVLLEAYFKRRPVAVLTRVWQVLSASSSYLAEVAWDYATGNTGNAIHPIIAILPSSIHPPIIP